MPKLPCTSNSLIPTKSPILQQNCTSTYEARTREEWPASRRMTLFRHEHATEAGTTPRRTPTLLSNTVNLIRHVPQTRLTLVDTFLDMLLLLTSSSTKIAKFKIKIECSCKSKQIFSNHTKYIWIKQNHIRYFYSLKISLKYL